MPERTVKTTLIIDDHGSVKVVKGVGDESGRTEHKLGGLDKQVKGLGKSFGGLKNMIGVGLGGLGVGGLIFGLGSVASKTKEIAVETEQFKTQTGLSAQNSLYYSKALKARGLTTEQVGKAFGILSKNVKTAELQEAKYGAKQIRAAATGKVVTGQIGRQSEAFEELGIHLQSFNKLSEGDKLAEITKKFEALPAGMKKTRLERELFGRGGNQLSIVLEKGNLGLTHQIALVKKFFPTIKGGANAMNELIEKQTESKMASEGLELALGEKLIPAMTSVMSWFSKVAQEIQKGQGTWGKLGKTVSEVAGFLKDAWKGFESIIGPSHAATVAISGLLGVMAIDKFAGLAGGIAKMGGSMSLLIWPAAFLGGLELINRILGGKKNIFQLFGEFLNPPKPKLYTGPAGTTEIPQTKKYLKSNEIVKHLERREEHREGVAHRAVGAHAAPSIEHIGNALNAFIAGSSGNVKLDLHLDSTKAAEAIIKNPRARRVIAESTAIYAQGMTARGPGAR